MPISKDTKREWQGNLYDGLCTQGFMKLIMVQNLQISAKDLGFPEESVLAQLMRRCGPWSSQDVKVLMNKAGECLETALKASAIEGGHHVQLKLMQWPIAMGLAGTELAKDFVSRGIKEAKVRITPQLHSVNVKKSKEKLAHEESIVKALIDGIEYATKTFDTKISLVFCVVPSEQSDAGQSVSAANIRTLLLVRKFANHGVAVDFGNCSAAEQETLTRLATEMNIPFVSEE